MKANGSGFAIHISNYFQFTIAPYFTYIYIYDYMYPYYIHMTIVYIRVGCIPLSKWVMTFNPRIINIYIYILILILLLTTNPDGHPST